MGVHLLDATGSSAGAGCSCGRPFSVISSFTLKLGVVGGGFLELKIEDFLNVLPRGGIVTSV